MKYIFCLALLVIMGGCASTEDLITIDPLPTSQEQLQKTTLPQSPTSTTTRIITKTSTPSPIKITATPENELKIIDYEKVFIKNKLLFDLDQDAPDCFGIGGIDYSPTREYFLINLGCFEGDNRAFIYKSNGENKREISGEWDYINYSRYSWSPDGRQIVYQRTNSCCVKAPSGSPPQGLIIYDVITGKKSLLYGTTSAPNWGYPASPSWSLDGNWIAFSFSEYNKSTTFYIINPINKKIHQVDIFDDDQIYGSFTWQKGTTENQLILEFQEDYGSISGVYLINEFGEVQTLGKPLPTLPLHTNTAAPTKPIFTAKENMFCRDGPATDFPDRITVMDGQSYPVLARWENNWLLLSIDTPITRSKCCWVGGVGDLNTSINKILLIDIIPDRMDCIIK